MTVIEIKPHRWGWKVFEAPGVEPVFQAVRPESGCIASNQRTPASGRYWLPEAFSDFA
jgi:hypothetical protein